MELKTIVIFIEVKASMAIYMPLNNSWNAIPIDKNVCDNPNPICKDYTNSAYNSHSDEWNLGIDFLPKTKAFSKWAGNMIVHVSISFDSSFNRTNHFLGRICHVQYHGAPINWEYLIYGHFIFINGDIVFIIICHSHLSNIARLTL